MQKTELSDLMNKVKNDRDELAFSKIFDFLAPKVNAYFIQNSIKADTAEELTQEVMSTIWVKSNLFNPSKSSLSTWTYTISRNKKVDFYRKNQRSGANEEDIREFLYEDNRANKIAEIEVKNQIDRISQGLDNNQRKIIKMNFFENKSHKKIAEELEIPLGTVKSRIRHILTKMNKLL